MYALPASSGGVTVNGTRILTSCYMRCLVLAQFGGGVLFRGRSSAEHCETCAFGRLGMDVLDLR